MTSFEEVNHLVHQNIFQARRRLLHQLQIQPDAPGRRIAATPARFHSLDAHVGRGDANLELPLGQKRR